LTGVVQEGVHGMVSLRSDEEVVAEIRKLKSLKGRLRSSSEGNDHHGAVDVQVKVLNEKMVEDMIIEIWGRPEVMDNATRFEAKEALVASGWLFRADKARAKPASAGWAPFLIERRKAATKQDDRQGDLFRGFT